MNVELDVFNCWVCGLSGSKLGYLMSPEDRDEYLGESSNSTLASPHNERLTALPPEFTPFCQGDPDKRAIYEDYLISRGVHERLWSLWRLGYAVEGRYAGRLIIPSFDKFGVPNFFSARAILPWIKPKYILPNALKDVISNEHAIDWSDAVFIVEGPFDQIAIGHQAICLWGTSIGTNQINALVTNRPPQIYICLDDDAQKRAFQMAQKLIRYDLNVSIVNMPGKDPSVLGRRAVLEAALIAQPFNTLTALSASV